MDNYKSKINEIINIIEKNIDKSKVKRIYETAEGSGRYWNRTTSTIKTKKYLIKGNMPVDGNDCQLNKVFIRCRGIIPFFIEGIELKSFDFGRNWYKISQLYLQRFIKLENHFVKSREKKRQEQIIKDLS